MAGWTLVSFTLLLLLIGFLAFNNTFEENICDQSLTSGATTTKKSVDVKLSVTQQQQIHQIEFKANELLRQSDREGLTHPTPGGQEVHYKVSKFQLSVGHSSSFDFSVHNANVPGMKLNETSYHNLTDKIICPVQHPNLRNLAHFSQFAFPCWSVLKRFPNAQRFVALSDVRRADLKGRVWQSDMLQVFESDGIKILDDDEKITTNSSSPEWRIEIVPGGSAWIQTDNNFQFTVMNTVFFLNQSDIQSLQKHVLGDDFIVKSGDESMLPLRVLLIERKRYGREWIHASETARQITAIWGGNEFVEVKILPNPEGSLKNQALEFHNADIIISPHGAQLTNLAFIRPCTSVLELFPAHYYLGFFQPYVLSAGAVSYDGYPFDRSPLYDTKDTGNAGTKVRVQYRGKSIMASPQSILQAFPRLVLSTVSCRRSINDSNISNLLY